MSGDWLDWCHKIDLSGHRGNGPFSGGYIAGIVLHVNDTPIGSAGTSPDYYSGGGGPNEVCPTWQVMTDGTTYQFLPINWQPWTQIAGNSWGPSIETGGNHAEPLTPAQIASCARIVAAVHTQYGVPLEVTDSLGKRGLGTHEMGGEAWGGHPCPGTIRAAQRSLILAAAGGSDPEEFTMDADAKKAFAELTHEMQKLNAAFATPAGQPRSLGHWLGMSKLKIRREIRANAKGK